ncbi:zinc-ribbon domain-containing protein [Demequina sp. NBRC 110054]|uniref:zinc-ribbon domain-containing protein n=1 Tax=Demequina sp. NBRC 110054 TaxID=1570343 RepID=UPI0013566509|nr:zinc-ribbon domain-containing protein [Demequina sp. NBRC 110054]
MKIPGTRSLAERWPELAKEFDVERNAPLTAADVSARSFRRVWWSSETCGHSWQDSPRGRTGRMPRDCQLCGGGDTPFVVDDPNARVRFDNAHRAFGGTGV